MSNEKVDMMAIARDTQLSAQAACGMGPGALKLIAPAKVNLFLDIRDQRTDGYHEAISIMHALNLHDVLHMELKPADQQGSGLMINVRCFEREGVAPIQVESEDNLACKAVRALASALGRTQDEQLTIAIEKHIPAQAGLGGGSSDAAAALVGIARLWGLDPQDRRVEDVARQLGADVAFFLHGGCACFKGVGDEFAHELAPMKKPVVLIKPKGGVSTAAAYRAFDECPQPMDEGDAQAALAATHAADVPLRNNLVCAAELLLDELAGIRGWMQQRDDVEDALMSGSGSAVFAVCPDFASACRLASDARAQGWWSRTTNFSSLRATIVPA